MIARILTGDEIDKNSIEIIKSIAYRRYNSNIFDDYFKSINSAVDLANLHSVRLEKENLVLGTDWFLCYAVYDYKVEILEWVSVDDDNKFQQSIEMMGFLKELLLKNRRKIFMANMRHDTSYQLYLKMLEKGYFKQMFHRCTIDCAAPYIVNEIKQKMMNKFDCIEDFLNSEECSNYSEYLTFVFHQLDFSVTYKFLKEYKNSRRKIKIKNIRRKQDNYF